MKPTPGSEPARSPLPKRFYVTAAAHVGEGPPYRVLLDGRPVRTPRKLLLALPSRALASAIAAEWAAQGSEIDPATMPLTRLANTTLDGIAGNEQAIRDDIAGYAMNDLVCYRAEAPADLAALQSRHWDPILAWTEVRLGCRFVLAAGVMPVTQPEVNRGSVLAVLSGRDAFALAATHVVTTLTGSALLALALAEGFAGEDQVWAAAHADEDYQIAQWGEDAEARDRRARRRAEFAAAVRFLRLAASS
jgi:chaperone required for assembly of F1-ATPase